MSSVTSASPYTLSIAGRQVAGQQFFDVINPATGRPFDPTPSPANTRSRFGPRAARASALTAPSAPLRSAERPNGCG